MSLRFLSATDWCILTALHLCTDRKKNRMNGKKSKDVSQSKPLVCFLSKSWYYESAVPRQHCSHVVFDLFAKNAEEMIQSKFILVFSPKSEINCNLANSIRRLGHKENLPIHISACFQHKVKATLCNLILGAMTKKVGGAY